MYHKSNKSVGLALLGLTLTFMTPAWAAKLVDLHTQPAASLQAFSATPATTKEISSHVDFKKTTHIRLQQLYSGYPVWGAQSIAHVPHGGAINNVNTLRPLLQNAKNNKSTMSGIVYQELDSDLRETPSYVFGAPQASKVLKEATELYQKTTGKQNPVKNPKTNLMVYVDDANKAHWVYLVSFLVEPAEGMPAKPTYIMDAITFKVYKNWDNIQTMDEVMGGGFGGNKKMGKQVYDGLDSDLPKLTIQQDAREKICYLQNNQVIVVNRLNADSVVKFGCNKINNKHNQVYWDGQQDAVNGAYSPANDAMYAGMLIQAMYQQWYDVPVLVQDGKPMVLIMRVHENIDNAYWDGDQMTFGDGLIDFYPLVSLGVGAHEISHGFTEQHSNLTYYGQSGALDESFSDMAAQAAEFYATGKNSWQIGGEVLKAKNQALRYMDDPTKDCEGRQPGKNCSIDSANDYKASVDVHYASGVFNKLFYQLATAEGWNTRKAFDVMVQANMNYWTPTTNFVQAACGVIQAAKDYQYDLTAVNKAINSVGIQTSACL